MSARPAGVGSLVARLPTSVGDSLVVLSVGAEQPGPVLVQSPDAWAEWTVSQRPPGRATVQTVARTGPAGHALVGVGPWGATLEARTLAVMGGASVAPSGLQVVGGAPAPELVAALVPGGAWPGAKSRMGLVFGAGAADDVPILPAGSHILWPPGLARWVQILCSAVPASVEVIDATGAVVATLTASTNIAAEISDWCGIRLTAGAGALSASVQWSSP